MKVLCFGSLNIDYVYSVDHFVAKGETLASTGLEVFTGGKGLNQSIALAKAGAEVYHAGAIGPDGKFLLEAMDEAGVNTDYVSVLTTARTGNAIIQRDIEGDNCILLYGGTNQQMTESFIDSVLDHFGPGDVLVLQSLSLGIERIKDMIADLLMLAAAAMTLYSMVEYVWQNRAVLGGAK